MNKLRENQTYNQDSRKIYIYISCTNNHSSTVTNHFRIALEIKQKNKYTHTFLNSL